MLNTSNEKKKLYSNNEYYKIKLSCVVVPVYLGRVPFTKDT